MTAADTATGTGTAANLQTKTTGTAADLRRAFQALGVLSRGRPSAKCGAWDILLLHPRGGNAALGRRGMRRLEEMRRLGAALGLGIHEKEMWRLGAELGLDPGQTAANPSPHSHLKCVLNLSESNAFSL